MLKLTASVVIAAALTTPALAAYWVVKNTDTNQCSIVQNDQKPSGDKIKVLGTSFKDQQTAESAKAHAGTCGSGY